MSSFKKYYFSCDPELSYLNTTYCGSFDGLSHYNYGPTRCDRYIITYIKSGKGTLTHNYKTYTLEAGCSYVIFPGYLFSHSTNDDDPWSYYWIEVYGTVLNKFLNLAELTPDNPVHEHTDLTVINQIIGELFQQYTTNNMQSELFRISLLHRFFNEMINDIRRPYIDAPLLEHVQSNKYIRKFIEYIAENYSKELTITELAHHVGLERSYFCRLFKRVAGTMPSSYILSYRMSKAKLLLMQTDYKIDEIAHLVGYKSAFQFSKMFKISAWMTPSEYRKRKSNTMM